jgi:hypothetical protein
VPATDRPALLINDFSHDLVDWYWVNAGHPPLWEVWTRKLKDPKWRGPTGARLLLDVQSTATNTLTFAVQCNEWDAFPGQQPKGKFAAVKKIPAAADWQTVTVSLADFASVEDPKLPGTQPVPKLTTWDTVTQFGLGAGGHVWQGPRAFRNLRWEK